MRSESTMKAFREDFEAKPHWSCAEAGRWSGLSPRTVYQWLRFGMFKAGLSAGPYRVDAQSFVAYMRTGTPQKVA